MNARIKNGSLIVAVAALAIIPLLIAKQTATGPDGKTVEAFRGADDQASAAIQAMAPDYKPWYQSIYKSPGPEIDNLLFALQGAIGAGFIGYYVGYCRGRNRKISAEQITKHAH